MIFNRADDVVLNIAEHQAKADTESRLQRKNIAFANSQTMKMQAKSDLSRPTNQSAGFQKAGFSPLAMLGNVMSAPVSSSVSAPSPSNGPVGTDDLSELAQAKLMLAQADKTQTEADRMHNEDEGSAESIKSYAEAKLRDNPDMRSEFKAYWQSVLERDDKSFNLGDVNSQMKFQELITKDVDTTANAIRKNYENYMWNAYLSGQMPYLEISKNKAEVKKLIGELANVEANTLLTTANTLMTPNMMKKIDSETAKNIVEANAIYNGDIVSLFKNGDYQALLVRAGDMALKGLIDYGAYRGAGKVLKSGLSANSAKSSTLKNTLDSFGSKASKQTQSILNPNKAQQINEKRRKYVERRENERRKILRNSAMPMSDYMM